MTLHNVSHHTHHRYECIASNGYPPDVARLFQLTIQFAPEINLAFLTPTNEELTSAILFIDDDNANEIRLKCRIIMNPFDQIYWTKNERKLINNHQIHQYVSKLLENHIIAELVVKDFTMDDQGAYACVASNALGTASKSIQLLSTPTTTTTSTTTATSTTTTDVSTRRAMISRRKRPKHTRTTTISSQEEFLRSTEILREMTISSRGKWWSMCFFRLCSSKVDKMTATTTLAIRIENDCHDLFLLHFSSDWWDIR